MADAVVTVFLEKLLNLLEKESGILIGVEEQLKKLKNELEYIQSFLKDAGRLKRKEEVLRCALADLRDIVYEAEDLLARYELVSINSGGHLSYWPPNKASFRYTVGKKLKRMNERITRIKETIRTYIAPISGNDLRKEEGPPRWSSPIYDHTQVVGLEGDTKKLKEWLFEADCGILAVGIVGMGGLGKTTLAQKVFNDKDVEIQFEKRIWVSVSQSLNEESILRSILRNLGDANIGDQCGDLLRRINQYLSGKRYLIVMDDVWTEDASWWKRIYAGLPKENKSCVIVTTRIEEVARKMGVEEKRMHRPKFLSKSDSWLLFCIVAFAANAGICTSNELEDIGKQIVSKCRGLPLAIKAVGGIMLCKTARYYEWNRIAEEFKEELDENDDSVKASLQLSYDELPSYLKSCFLSLSIYPEDCVISKDQLVRWWIGEGFVPLRNGRLSTEAAEDCFSGLTNRCLVEVVEWDYNGKISTCKVHDMVRDLVIKIAIDDSFSGENVSKCRHMGVNTDIVMKHIVNKKKKLRALVSTSKSGEVNKIGSDIANKFCDFWYIRVLDLSKSIFDVPLGTLLGSVGNLKLLASFNLSNTHPLTHVPASLQKVNKLQVLDLSYCQSLKCLPPFVMNFQKLAILDASHCGSLEFFPRGLEKLSNLQVLLGFKPARKTNAGSRISDLRNLSRLRILELQFTRVDEIDDGETGTLTELKKLQSLTISCFNSYESGLVYKLEKLCPPRMLHELSLKFYPGKISPKWLNPTSLSMLCYLSISGGNLTKLNGNFWEGAWRIEGMKLDSLSHLNMEWKMTQQVMPSLKTVHACWCPELKDFPIDGVGFRGGEWKKEDRHSYTQPTDKQTQNLSN